MSTTDRAARRERAMELVARGEVDASLPLWRDEIAADDGLAWLQHLVTREMQRGDLALAGAYASIHARLRWGDRDGPRVQTPAFTVTVPKLAHDVEQLAYLLAAGALGDDIAPLCDAYQRAIDRLAARGPHARVSLDDECAREIADAYNRIVHVRDTPRVARALSDRWRPDDVERNFVETPPGIVVVDDFLSREALDGVRAFCLESTVWSTNRYAHGRLGAFFEAGFNCPLLLQIAEEVARALPRIIGDRYPLRQLWAFKYGETLPRDASTHADFAAVSVNFWITPDDANLDPSSGGLIVYDVDAPRHWSFERYQNTGWDQLEPFLRGKHARATSIAYRQNRAILFNSDLFHGTDMLAFRPGYQNRRINITMLFGDRENDVHHPALAHRSSLDDAPPPIPAWRSAALTRARRGRR